MDMLQKALEEMKDYSIDQVNRYIKGEHVHYKRGRYEREHVTSIMIHAIEKECGIHPKGIEIGRFHYGMYEREKKRIARYWKKVRAGEIIDTRRGFEKERKR